MSQQKISTQVQEKALAIEKQDAAATLQKKQQVAEQEKAKEDQIAAQAEKVAADDQAKKEELNKKLAEIPKEIDKKIEALQETLDGLLGKLMPSSSDPNNIDFDPDEIIGKMKSAVNPVMSGIGPVESVVGKVPVLGDLMGLMSSMASNSSPSKLSKKEIKKLVPKPPSIPEELKNSLSAIIDDIEAFCKQLPMLLIDIIFQILAVIPDLINQIAGVIGVPSLPFPLSIVTQFPPLIPKIKKLVTELPSQAYKLIEGVVKQKYAEAMALSVPTPPVATPEQLAEIAKKKAEKEVEEAKKKAEAEAKKKEEQTSGGSSETQTEEETTTATKSVPEPTQKPPVTSSIPDTPSITPPEAKSPKAPDPKPEQKRVCLIMCLGADFRNVYGSVSKEPEKFNSVFTDTLRHWMMEDFPGEFLKDNPCYKIEKIRGNYVANITYPNQNKKYSTKEDVEKYFLDFVEYAKKKCDGEVIIEQPNSNDPLYFNVNKKKFLGIF